MSKFNTRTLCRVAMLAALYVLLNNTIAIKAGNLRITFASLPVVLSALLFGPLESAVTALAGEFINQLIGGYGITATTALWLIPPAVRGVVIGMELWRSGVRTAPWSAVRCWDMPSVCWRRFAPPPPIPPSLRWTRGFTTTTPGPMSLESWSTAWGPVY